MMKKTMMAFAALAAFQAGAITATKEYVDRRDTEIRTNTYTKAETDARIGELAPRTSLEPATNYTDEVAAYKRGVKDLAVYGGYAPWKIWDDDHEMAWNERDNGWSISAEDYGADRWLSWSDGVWTLEGNLDSGERFAYCTNGFFALRIVFDSEVLWRTSIYVTNGAHIVTSNDIAPAISNTVTKAFVEDLGIESGVDAQTVTNIAQSALGEFANTGTVYNAQNAYNANNATDSEFAMYSSSAYSLEGTNEYRTADQIFHVLDESASTNYADTAAADAVASADTSYPRYMTITNLNQSVQFLNITNTEPSSLVIEMPTDGRTKDWIVYVYAATNVTLTLPSSMTYWMADVAYTNDVPPAKPTAFYFSQISTNIFYLGRQELTEVTAP